MVVTIITASRGWFPEGDVGEVKDDRGRQAQGGTLPPRRPQCFLIKPTWLEVGWALWQRCGITRDYFLVLPSAYFGGIVELEASYTDSQACSRALMRMIKLPSGLPFITIPVGVEFWTEHGDRATLPSIAAVIGDIPSDWIDLLGHWTSKSSVGYVRTMIRRIGHIQ